MLPDPEASPLWSGASGCAEVDVRGGSVMASEEVNTPDEVLARSVSTPPRLLCSSRGFLVLGEG